MINDSGHKPIGIESIEEDNNKIIINYDFDASFVHSFTVTPDEEFVISGISSGASVGLSKAYIFLTKIENGKVISINPKTIDNNHANLWLYGVFSQ